MLHDVWQLVFFQKIGLTKAAFYFSILLIFTNQWQIVESIKLWTSVDGMLGIRTQGHRSQRVEGEDESTKQWRYSVGLPKLNWTGS